jgi:hypothetical protein
MGTGRCGTRTDRPLKTLATADMPSDTAVRHQQPSAVTAEATDPRHGSGMPAPTSHAMSWQYCGRAQL